MKRLLKFLLYSAGIIGVLVLIFLSIGWFSDELSFQSKVEVNATPAECWAVLQNPGYMEKWMEGFDEIEFVSGVPGEVGSTYRLLFKDGEEMNAILETLTVMEENERLGFDMHNDFLDGSMDIVLKASKIGTTISATTEFTGSNAMMQSMFVLMKESIAHNDQKNYDNLKAVIEQQTGR